MVSWPTIALVVAAAATSKRCPSPFEEFNGKCYYVSKHEMEHFVAKAQCTAMGGVLAKVSNLDTAQHVCHDNRTTWIGLKGSSDGWTWTDGSEFVKEEDFGGHTLPSELPNTEECVYVDCRFDDHLHFLAVPCSDPWNAKYACELPSECPMPYEEFNGKCYYVNEERVNHRVAESECSEMGGILANVSDEGTARHLCNDNGTTWIGLTGSSDGWTWADGSEFVKEEDFGGETLPSELPNTEQCVYIDCTFDDQLHFFGVPCQWPWNGKYACELQQPGRKGNTRHGSSIYYVPPWTYDPQYFLLA